MYYSIIEPSTEKVISRQNRIGKAQASLLRHLPKHPTAVIAMTTFGGKFLILPKLSEIGGRV